MWRARDGGLWSRELAEAVCASIEDKPAGSMDAHVTEPAVFLMEHTDGLRSATLMLSGYVRNFVYAARADGQVHGAEFYLKRGGPIAHFSYLCRNIQMFFQTGVAPYPPERTPLATGIIDAVMISRYEGHRFVETPNLDIAYQSYDDMPFSPTGPRPSGVAIGPQAPDIV